MRQCEKCPFQGQAVVEPEGSTASKIVLIGEAPGKDEERTGRPFVGAAGRLLNKLLRGARIGREECYITNVLKCRPPNNKLNTRAAQKAIQCCRLGLLDELKRCNPHITVPMGNTSLHAIGIDYAITSARGAIFRSSMYGKIIPTWHPAYIPRTGFVEIYAAQKDWQKIRRHSYSPDFKPPAERFNLFPTIDEVEEFQLSISQRVARGEKVTLAVDLETYREESPMDACIKLIGLATSAEDAIVVPFYKEDSTPAWETPGQVIRAIMAVGSLLENPKITKLMQYGMFDMQVLMNHGFGIGGPILDTYIAHMLVYHPSAHDLLYIASLYTDCEPWKLVKHQKDDFKFRKYNAYDVVVLHQIWPGLFQDIKDNGLEWVFFNHMENMLPTARMIVNGLPIRREKQQEISQKINVEVQQSVSRLRALCGHVEFNPSSHPQLSHILFDEMKLRSGVKTTGGKKSTKAEVLNRLSIRYPDNKFVKEMLTYRGLEKMRSTYIDPPVGDDGRVHSQFNPVGTVTGRFASRDPNLMNLPAKYKDEQQYIRGLYGPPDGRCLVGWDWEQIELRIMAILSGDKILLDVFSRGEDPHRSNCIDIFGEYKDSLRRFAKNFIYALIYGSKGQRLEEIAPKEVLERGNIKNLMDRWMSKHPAIQIYWDSVEKDVIDNGVVYNPFGRPRYFPGRPSAEDLRAAVNSPIQSTVSEMMHLAMPRIDAAMSPDDMFVLNLHDGMYAETSTRRQITLANIGKMIMEEPVTAPNGMVFQIPCEASVGATLGDMSPLKAA